jgi:acetyltransferase-like isoleucine patch superfamily enzyme
VIDESARLGLYREASLRGQTDASELLPVRVGEDCMIGAGVVVHDSTQIGSRCFIDDHCRIGFGCAIGDDSRLEYGASVCDRVRVGVGCVLAGFICDGVSIGDRAIVMGVFAHKLAAPRMPWGVLEPAATVEDGAVIGLGATVVGGIVIGRESYVTAGSTVTKDVPPRTVIVGINTMIPFNEWPGLDLKL